MNRQINPKSIAAPNANHAHAVLTEAASRWLHTSGAAPTRPDGSVPTGIDEQAEVVWANLGAVLSQAGMRPADIVSVTIYAVVGEPLAPILAARDRFMGGRKTASTLVTVPGLAQSAWKLEIAIIAAAA